jgi:hypothetical protein
MATAKKATNLNLFDNPLPNHFGIDDKVVPNLVFDLGFVPLFVVEHFIVPFDPNGPEGNASKEVPNFNLFSYSMGILSPKIACFQLKLS